MKLAEILTIALTVIIAGGSVLAWLLNVYFKKEEEIETLRNGNTKSALHKLDKEIVSFKDAINSIQTTVKDLNASLMQNRNDVALLKERLDDTKKMLELYEKNHDNKMKNLIKTEITELTKTIMLIRNRKNN